MTRIFISYSRADETFGVQLATALANLGADIWIDVEDIPAGMKWSSAIQQGLDTAEALIVIISPESMASRNVEDEWQYFLDNKKPVIPVLLRNAKIHFQLNRIQWIDFLHQSFELALIQLHAELRRNGIKLQAPVAPSNGEKPLTHGHALPPRPDPIVSRKAIHSNQTILYGLGVVGIVLIITVIGLIVATSNNTGAASATLDAQSTSIRDLELVTQQFLSSPTATRTQIPTTSTPTSSPTPLPINLGPISDNTHWTPIERRINGVVMVLVPSGSFRLGASQEHFDANLSVCIPKLGENSCTNILGDEFNGNTITINEPYWLDKYEVSQQVYGSSNSSLPQVNVTSGQAQDHCETRQGSLPNEAEWEFAAKGPNNWRYPWGNSWNLAEQRANICDVNCSQNWAETNYNDGNPENALVTDLPSSASWVGAYNMVGNVWEWTSDVYNPTTTNTLRGGSWTWVQAESTTTSRSDGIAPQTNFYGFRCARPYTDGDLEHYNN